ncbi:Cysteine desulfurase [Vibrio aerogenes CECT 7868]|uniref:Cysteine desulfurase n=1 Tax=Vibrio aerogenes CECT 7868 TaxID=1216006 RepID=A0A1M5XR59_9VIBR|nr:SufS family cysteine desulfurase [Vibrio aerogenes]SHI02311.1 Cysteine desulfurase [Vibrio aerogenes CECT 7868]
MTTAHQLPLSSPWRQDFPVLNTQVHDKPLVYLDTAATAQTPDPVIRRMEHFYRHEYSNVHRGNHQLSMTATENMEQVRHQVAGFINAPDARSIVFTKGTTEAINLVAQTFVRSQLQPGDEIIVTEMDHHANLVPWQMAAQALQLKIKVWPVTPSGELETSDLKKLITDKTRFLAVTHVSNVLGTINPVHEYIQVARQHQMAVLVDGAQAVLHQKVDVQALDCDFYVFSAHKLYGPTGTGVLFVKPHRYSQMPPWEGGGAMIDKVVLPLGTTFNKPPLCFEAGTPNIAGILGMGAAISYLMETGIDAICRHENNILNYCLAQLQSVDDVVIYGNPKSRTGCLAFNLSSHHAYDVGTFFDHYGIAIRTGHHCAMPLIERLGQNSVCRASFGMYTNKQDIDRFISALHQIKALLD